MTDLTFKDGKNLNYDSHSIIIGKCQSGKTAVAQKIAVNLMNSILVFHLCRNYSSDVHQYRNRFKRQYPDKNISDIPNTSYEIFNAGLFVSISNPNRLQTILKFVKDQRRPFYVIIDESDSLTIQDKKNTKKISKLLNSLKNNRNCKGSAYITATALAHLHLECYKDYTASCILELIPPPEYHDISHFTNVVYIDELIHEHRESVETIRALKEIVKEKLFNWKDMYQPYIAHINISEQINVHKIIIDEFLDLKNTYKMVFLRFDEQSIKLITSCLRIKRYFKQVGHYSSSGDTFDLSGLSMPVVLQKLRTNFNYYLDGIIIVSGKSGGRGTSFTSEDGQEAYILSAHFYIPSKTSDACLVTQGLSRVCGVYQRDVRNELNIYTTEIAYNKTMEYLDFQLETNTVINTDDSEESKEEVIEKALATIGMKERKEKHFWSTTYPQAQFDVIDGKRYLHSDTFKPIENDSRQVGDSLDNSEIIAITKKWETYAKNPNKNSISKLISSIDPEHLYSKEELQSLFTEAGYRSSVNAYIRDLTQKHSSRTNTYGRMCEKVGSKIRIHSDLIDLHRRMF